MAESLNTADRQIKTPTDPKSTGRFFLWYDILMMMLISANLLIMAVDHLLFTHLAVKAAAAFQQSDWLLYYRQQLHPKINDLNEWITLYLIGELMLRWVISIILKHHHRWFFFPFIHWYEFLAIIPALRALRLLRVIVIGYRLHQLGYRVIPKNILKNLVFYYEVVLEELSDRIVLTILDGVERELKTESSNHLVKQLINHHRTMLNQAIAETLQHNLASALHAQQPVIVQSVGQIVNQAIADTPELHNLLRLLPVIGSRIEQQIQGIGQRLGENITKGLIKPFSQPAQTSQLANPALQTVADYIGEIQIEEPALQQLVESLVFESLETIRAQVKIQHWKVSQAAQTEIKPLSS